MRTLVIIAAVVLGVAVVSGLVAATGNGRDNTGKTVPASRWANDVCGTVGAWEGDLKSIREELRRSNYGARRSDGSAGDAVEQAISIRSAVNRAILVTQTTLQRGLKRAGIPDASKGKLASLTVRAWGKRTEINLRVAKAQLKRKPTSTSEAFAALAAPIGALARSAVDGRVVLKYVAALDPALADALNGSHNCRRLASKRP
jgi:hypothetical protein